MNQLETAIAIRAYSERPDREPLGAKPASVETESPRWTLVFDTETAIDATQRPRFGFYQVRDGVSLHEEGLFYDPAALNTRERRLVQRFAADHDLRILTVGRFCQTRRRRNAARHA